MSTFLILLLVAAAIALIIGLTVQAINGDDGQDWPHNTTGNEHQWK